MSALAWLAIPVAALALATLWVGWASRPRPRADTHETVQAHQRFVAAFEARRDEQRRLAQPGEPHRRSA